MTRKPIRGPSGDKVLALLLVHGRPLQAHYCSPFVIERKVNDVDYVIRTTGRRKTNRLCHINMLKAYHARESVTLMTTAVGDTEGVAAAEIVEKGPKLQNSDILSNTDQKLAHFPEMEQEQLKSLITEFNSIFPDTPGRTQVVYHDVDVEQAQPVKQRIQLNKRLSIIRVFWCPNQMEVTDSVLTLGE